LVEAPGVVLMRVIVVPETVAETDGELLLIAAITFAATVIGVSPNP
jgi:hypothetical protein